MGYTWEGMQKISYEKAREMFLEDGGIYLLYDDNTEGEADTIEEIDAHNEYGGEFGIER